MLMKASVSWIRISLNSIRRSDANGKYGVNRHSSMAVCSYVVDDESSVT